jgi:hypothetical protein
MREFASASVNCVLAKMLEISEALDALIELAIAEAEMTADDLGIDVNTLTAFALGIVATETGLYEDGTLLITTDPVLM